MSKENLPADGAEKKLLQKEEEAKTETRVDMADAKFIVGDHKTCDANIELDANKRQFAGLTKEELLKYAEDPFWIRLRWFMFSLFWVLWFAMLAGAIAIIIQAPKCTSSSLSTWYSKGPVVDMSSAENYKEIEDSLPRLKSAKVAGVFTFACKDAYDVLENKSGCIQQFKAFAVKAKEFGVKVIVDLVANYVPKTHTWFQLSENRSEEYGDYFIWAKGGEFDADQTSDQPKPPNNWVSTLNEPAWTWSKKREEFYLHQFGENQPDLNFHNPEVVRKFDAVIKIWMEAGASGIRLLNGRELLVNTSFVDEVQETGSSKVPGADHTQYGYYRHRHTSDHPALDQLLAHWAYLTRGDGETVFTLKETEGRAELFLLQRNTSALRPPSAAPQRVRGADAAEPLARRLPRRPFLQLMGDGETEVELVKFAMMLPAAPVLSLEQLPEAADSDNKTSDKFTQLVSLRNDPVIERGRTDLVVVVVNSNSTQPLLGCIRWKEDSDSYVAVFNPYDELAHADLSNFAVIPARLSTYITKELVKSDEVPVPAKSTVILSFAPRTMTEG